MQCLIVIAPHAQAQNHTSIHGKQMPDNVDV